MADYITRSIGFIRDTFKSDENIPLHEPLFIGNGKRYVTDAIDSTFVSSIGKYVDQFENHIAQISQTKRAVAVMNGTSALHIALKLAGVKNGDEVLTQALTFVATANAIIYNQAKPVFLDVDIETMGLSPDSVKFFLEEFGDLREDGCYNKKTGNRIAACLPMHTFGFPVHLNELLNICSDWNIPIVEDAAEALGSLYHGKPAGSFGETGIYSFNGNKIVTGGGGGAIVTNDEETGSYAKHLTTTAKKGHRFEYVHDEVGYNYRLPNLNAALLCAQLERLDEFIDIKRKLAGDYEEFFKQMGVKFRTENANTKANYWLMCVELEDRAERNSFLEQTNNEGIMTRPIWQLMYKLPMYAAYYRDAQKNAKFLEDRVVNIPSSVIINE